MTCLTGALVLAVGLATPATASTAAAPEFHAAASPLVAIPVAAASVVAANADNDAEMPIPPRAKKARTSKMEISEELARQIALDDVRDPMQAHLEANFSDYTGEVIPNYGDGTLTVQIKSGAPVEVSLAVMAFTNAVPVSIQESAYSYKELTEAGKSLMAKLEGQPAVAAV